MNTCLGLILAGGTGSRMGGLDKALLRLGGEPLLARAARRLAPQVSALAISSNRGGAAPILPELPRLADPLPGQLGPLAGILAGLIYAEARGLSHVLSVAVDTPFFPETLARDLTAAGQGGLALATSAEGLHPTFGLWPVSLRAPLGVFLAEGGRKMRAFTQAHAASTAEFKAESFDPFFNINTPEQLQAAELICKTGTK